MLIGSFLLAATAAPVFSQDLSAFFDGDPGASSTVPTVGIQGLSEGEFRFGPDLVVRFADPSLRAHAEVFASELEALTGVRPAVQSGGLPAASPAGSPAGSPTGAQVIELGLAARARVDAAGLPGELYELFVEPDRVAVQAANVTGVAWGTATLLQVLEPADGAGASIPCMRVLDEPAAPYRSVMIDVARARHSIDVLHDVVRLARLYKIRFVQLHLTDDQLFTFPFEPVVSNLKGNTAYDRDALVGLVDFASACGVTLVPEVDLPGHSRRLVESGYLKGAASDRDVASEQNAEALFVLLDDVMEVFHTSPYFHIGGDESGAGDELVPFLERVNAHVRSRGKRLIVWEGFHGAPLEALPATGDDRILVASWESSYNAPWDLLGAGYELINASWMPLYVVGGDSLIHPGSSAGRKWSPETMASWNKDRFMHWEPGRAVFEDRGPEDTNLDDGIWDVPTEAWRNQILGGQISVWEQRETSLIRDLRERIPVLAERLWAGPTQSTSNLMTSLARVDKKIWGLVQPVEVVLSEGELMGGPIGRITDVYSGDGAAIRLRNRTRLKGEVRRTLADFSGDWNWIDPAVPAAPTAVDGGTGASFEGGASVRAGLYLANGERFGAETWARFQNWPARVRVTEYDIGRRTPRPRPDGRRIPDFGAFAESRVTSRHVLPMLRGPLAHEGVKGQRFEATLMPTESGDFEIAMKTQSGHATLWADLDGDGVFTEAERLIPETPNTEERVRAALTLNAGEGIALRVDHVSALPRPVVIVTLGKPGDERPADISGWLAPL